MQITYCRIQLAFVAGLAALAVALAGPSLASGEKKYGQYSGFEGSEAELGRAVADAIQDAQPGEQADHDFAGREKALGLAVSTVIKTLNHNKSYQHDMNDALVKMTLGHVQFAKDNGLLDEIVAADVDIQRKNLAKFVPMIAETGDVDLAIVAMFEQTTCFFQLVEETVREPGRITYKSPFGVVLEQTRKAEMHDLTEQEVHDVWTKPRLRAFAEILGVDLDVSDLDENGMITVSVAPIS